MPCELVKMHASWPEHQFSDYSVSSFFTFIDVELCTLTFIVIIHVMDSAKDLRTLNLLLFT